MSEEGKRRSTRPDDESGPGFIASPELRDLLFPMAIRDVHVTTGGNITFEASQSGTISPEALERLGIELSAALAAGEI